MHARVLVSTLVAAVAALAASTGHAVTPTWADEADDFNALPLLCDGDISFSLDENAPALKGKREVLDYMVSQAAFGSGVETRDHLVRVRAADLDQSNFVTSFDNIYDVLVSMPETAPVAEAYNTELDETVAALQAEEKSNRLFIFENAEPQGGNLEQLFVYDKVNATFGLLVLSCG